MHATMLSNGLAREKRSAGLLDGGTPYYSLYATSDGGHMSVGGLEPQFWAEIERLLEPYLDAPLPDRNDPTNFPALRQALTDVFASRTLAEWTQVFDGTDACIAPVLPMTEAAEHPHLKARETYVERDGVLQPAPAPRFSRTRATISSSPQEAGASTREALAAWGVADVEALIDSGAAVQR